MNTGKLFEAFEKHPKSRRTLSFQIRRSSQDDLDAIALIAQERRGGSLSAIRESMKKRLALPPSSGALFVAQLDQDGAQVVAFGGSAYLGLQWEVREPAKAPLVPTGWYLTGVVVHPQARRAGIGRALTEARIQCWRDLEERSKACPMRFVVNAQNQASIDLHKDLGFCLESTEFHMPGVEFTGGEGLLFRLD